MSKLRNVVRVVLTGSWLSGSDPACLIASPKATSTAAPPPTALNRLTSWGIAVIFTRRAVSNPARPPPSRPRLSAIVAVAVIAW